MKSNFKSFLMLIIMVVAVILAVSVFTDFDEEAEKFTYGDLVEALQNDAVKELKVDGESSVIAKIYAYRFDKIEKPVYEDDGVTQKTDSDGNPVFETEEVLVVDTATVTEYQLQIVYNFQLERISVLAEESLEGGNLEIYEIEPPEETPWYVTYLPFIITVVLILVLGFFVMRNAGGGGKMNSFSKSKAKVTVDDKNAVKFADVAGADEEKAELEEVVEFLKDPSKFVKLGARIPRGVLLVGPPGTGKTLLAKAVAGEAGVPFFSISGSDFVEMYVGVGASRVRDLFENARKTPASIIFIDEIDAVGRHRGAGLGGGHDEREQTLNQLLVEMDGFGTNSGVIVIAATNRPDILDPALLRPGRFDRQVTVNYPDIKGREEILKVHCRNKPLEDTVDLGKIAQTTIGFTGAELANLMNEAALLAAKRDKSLIGMNDIEDSYMKLILGPQKKKKVRTEADNKLCAYHEAGHAVASYFCKYTDPVKHITIIPAGSAGGVTISVPTEDRMTTSKNAMIDRIVLSLGGRVAEEIILDDISTGASSDIQQATSIARNMVTRYGMSKKLGTVLYGSEHSNDEVFLGRDFSSGKNYSEKTAAEIDEEVRDIIGEAYERCKSILTEHIDKLHFVANFLLKNESMDEEQFVAAMESEAPVMEDIEAIETARKRRSADENRRAQEQNKKREEEKRAKAAEEAKKRGEGNGFLGDDFFASVWDSGKIVKEEQKQEKADDNKSCEKEESETDAKSDDASDKKD